MPINFHCDCGKPFWTADANAGRRMLCTRCGREIGVPQSREEGIVFIEPARTSWKAIAGLVLGLISLGLGAWTGLPAILFGAMGASDVGQSQGRCRGKWLAEGGIVLGLLGTILGFVFPGPTCRLGESARRVQCINNLRQVGLALHAYHSEHGAFPSQAITDSEGRPLLSWRVAILPYIDQQELYDKFKLDEPWDSPNNWPLIEKMPSIFRCPSDLTDRDGKTRDQVVAGPGALFEGQKPPSITNVTDDPANTLCVVEAKDRVTWSKPEDVDIRSIPARLGSDHPSGYHVLMVDGYVKTIDRYQATVHIRAYATRAGGEGLGERD